MNLILSVKTGAYKVNIQKSLAFIYTNSRISEKETRGKIPIIMGDEERKKSKRRKRRLGK